MKGNVHSEQRHRQEARRVAQDGLRLADQVHRGAFRRVARTHRRGRDEAARERVVVATRKVRSIAK